MSQKVLTPKPAASRKSPLSGWAGGDTMEKDSNSSNGIIKEVSLHDNQVEIQPREEEDKVDESGDKDIEKENKEKINDKKDEEKKDSEKYEVEGSTENVEKDHGEINNSVENDSNQTDITENKKDVTENKNNESEKDNEVEDDPSVQKEELNSVISDNDKIDVKTEDYLE